MRIGDQIHNKRGIRARIQCTVCFKNQTCSRHNEPEQIRAEQPQKAKQKIGRRTCRRRNCHTVLGIFDRYSIKEYVTDMFEYEYLINARLSFIKA